MRRPFRAGNRRLLRFGAEHAAGPPQNERVVRGEAGTPTPEDQCAGILARHNSRRRFLSLQEPLALGLENSDMTFFSRSQFPIKLFMGTGSRTSTWVR